MAYDKYFDPSFTYHLLVGFRLFITPIELFNELITCGVGLIRESNTAPTSYEVPPQPSSKQHTIEVPNFQYII